MALGNAGEAEFKKENATGVFEVEVAVTGKLKNAMVAALGAVFLAAAEALEVGENVGTVSDHSPAPARRLFLVLAVAALNTVFVYWIFSSLSKTLNKLKVSSTEVSQNVFFRFRQ